MPVVAGSKAPLQKPQLSVRTCYLPIAPQNAFIQVVSDVKYFSGVIGMSGAMMAVFMYPRLIEFYYFVSSDHMTVQ
jgi:hypothetical protein